MKKTTLPVRVVNTADWHAELAMQAYRYSQAIKNHDKRNFAMAEYIRHIHIADKLRRGG